MILAAAPGRGPVLDELADLLAGMSPEDVERVLDLARRLSGR